MVFTWWAEAGRCLLVALDLGHAPQRVPLPEGAGAARLLLLTHMDREKEEVRSELALRPAEGVTLELPPG